VLRVGRRNEILLIRYIGLLKAYIHDFNARMNATHKIDEFSKKYIFLGGLQK
jgi:hypothetical protein